MSNIIKVAIYVENLFLKYFLHISFKWLLRFIMQSFGCGIKTAKRARGLVKMIDNLIFFSPVCLPTFFTYPCSCLAECVLMKTSRAL